MMMMMSKKKWLIPIIIGNTFMANRKKNSSKLESFSSSDWTNEWINLSWIKMKWQKQHLNSQNVFIHSIIQIESNWIESNSFIWIDFRLMNKHTCIMYFFHIFFHSMYIYHCYTCVGVGVCVCFFSTSHILQQWELKNENDDKKKYRKIVSLVFIRRFYIVTIVRENLYFFFHILFQFFQKRKKTTNKYDKLNCDNIDWWNIFFLCLHVKHSVMQHSMCKFFIHHCNSSIEHLAMIGHSIDIDCRFYFCSFTIYLSYGNSWEMQTKRNKTNEQIHSWAFATDRVTFCLAVKLLFHFFFLLIFIVQKKKFGSKHTNQIPPPPSNKKNLAIYKWFMQMLKDMHYLLSSSS
mgnify:CR=1 FL=1